MTSFDFFPPLEPNRSGLLAVDPPHKLYWEECGNPNGKPVLFLHGGPGIACGPIHRRFFDPAHYRIFLFDQRGAGRSSPHGEVSNNTTAHLIADIEKLRTLWGIESWHVFGGSWGSTLALAYAEAHPERVSGLILRGIFIFRQWEIDWFLTGLGIMHPEANDKFLSLLPPEQRRDPLPHFYALLTNPDPAVHMPIAHAWCAYELSTSTLLPNPELVALASDDIHALGLARLEAHYFTHSRFEPDDQLLRNIDRIRHIPAVIIQGQYDLVCPARSAHDLHLVWPEAEYIVIADAGHSAFEPGIRSALIAATEKFKAIG